VDARPHQPLTGSREGGPESSSPVTSLKARPGGSLRGFLEPRNPVTSPRLKARPGGSACETDASERACHSGCVNCSQRFPLSRAGHTDKEFVSRS
jgi:hypothetical protein